MRRLFIALTMVFALTIDAAAQKTLYRHDPKIISEAGDTTDDEIVAYSDTIGAGSMAADSMAGAMITYDSDDTDNGTGTNMTFDDVSNPFELMAYLSYLCGLGGVLIAALVAILCLLTVLSPVILIAVILYFIMKIRNRKYKIIEKSLESGQPIPQELLRENKTSNDKLWSSGIRNAAVGVGIVLFGFVIHAGFFTGVGWILFFYGVGQAVVARTTAGGRRHDNGQMFMDDIRDDSRNDDRE